MSRSPPRFISNLIDRFHENSKNLFLWMKADFLNWAAEQEWFLQLINMRLTCDCSHILGLTCLSDRHCVPSAIKWWWFIRFYRLIELTKGRHAAWYEIQWNCLSKEIPHGWKMFRNRSEEVKSLFFDEYHSSIINNNVNCKHHCEQFKCA